MKLFCKIVFSLLIINQGCIKNNEITQHFSSATDTLIIKTRTLKGQGLFPINEGSVYFQDTTGDFTYSVIFPDNITKIKRAQRFVDLKAWRYDNFKLSSQEKLPNYILEDIKDKKLDTSKYVSQEDNYIDIITGFLEEERIFIVDENHNKDFRDDSIRLFQPVNLDSVENIAMCKFNIYNGEEIVKDSTWVNIEQFSDYSGFWFCVYEHLIVEFLIDGEYFKIGIKEEQSGFPYQYPILALLANNSSSKDSLLEKDILHRNEYVKLNNNYYRFDNISNGGDYLTLIKEKDFEVKVGIQVGMLAPKFKCISITGDTIQSSDLHDKILVIANICGCGGDTLTAKEYSKMVSRYESSIYILAMDSKINNDLGGVLIDTEDELNKEIYSEYRNAYCSRTCYVIDSNNRIIDKFQTRDWLFHLPSHLLEH